MSYLDPEVIDLTESYIGVNNRCYTAAAAIRATINTQLANNDVIVLDTDESFNEKTTPTKLPRKSKKSPTPKKKNPLQKKIKKKNNNRKSLCNSKVGDCAICCEQLGTNPMASTKCGHVFCLNCLQRSLRSEKRCPMCRCFLKGPSAYHPLYLDLAVIEK